MHGLIGLLFFLNSKMSWILNSQLSESYWCRESGIILSQRLNKNSYEIKWYILITIDHIAHIKYCTTNKYNLKKGVQMTWSLKCVFDDSNQGCTHYILQTLGF